ncbi:Uncharacterised protein [Vibrio cholerae]|nr:Uncharacterised protein [Vibrio cholerae]
MINPSCPPTKEIECAARIEQQDNFPYPIHDYRWPLRLT